MASGSDSQTILVVGGIAGITVEDAVNAGADVIATPCPLRQTNVEMYQDAVLNQNTIRSTKLEYPAKKK
ncbi:MAG: hypothetical protein EXR02_03075 [Rhodospirillales bacterium]|nr:hypothetical protein [Rhodospirillales bacterium]